MSSSRSISPGAPDTIAELRDLYRAAEARAARLRLLIDAGRDLATSDAETLPAVLEASARRAAHFAGYRDGKISLDPNAEGMPLLEPGPEQRRVGTLTFSGEQHASATTDAEDREALRMLTQLIGAAVDRSERRKEREDLLAALQNRERQLEHLVGRLFSAQEDERRYVSRELHDGVAQTATALYRRLDACAGPGSEPEDAELAGIAKSLVTELRSVIAGLRPTALDDLGAVSAIRTLAEQLERDGFDVSYEAKGDADWPAKLDTPLFRVAQEAIANIRKHAGGHCRVDIKLVSPPHADKWRLVVRDHGKGLPSGLAGENAEGEHVGLEMMRERMVALGGGLDVENAEPGVRITAEVGPRNG
ncbi:histidine kinase [Parvularcula sp. ZS-1/3]|uniref:histidine kinase n=1 Tax=Parvularcula mediterranea TaxID=2732508 RepID=A0A7Y3W5T5_9PROT|nr:ATP-binding protein [Parvularcula mediterranea]NNU16838.1 histidine kinase [Parvularcula mediterranea]